MIITRTPFRISLAGGGTDLAEFYEREEGAVVNMAINRYMYITVHPRFEPSIRVSYSKTEIVNKPGELHHEIVREALAMTGVQNHIEIISMADIPANTGLGSSSAFTVGLLHALRAHRGKSSAPETIASLACRLEIERVKEPIGKQDQYIAAYGGVHHFTFHPNGSVGVEPLPVKAVVKKKLENQLLLFYTGMTRRASDVLTQQQKETPNKMAALRRMRDFSREIVPILKKGKDLSPLGEILHECWLLKRSLAGGITNGVIDDFYDRARRRGALGGKILGAGGGGFLLIFAEPKSHGAIRRELKELRELKWAIEPKGSSIIHQSP